jgi:hypothetical protein
MTKDSHSLGGDAEGNVEERPRSRPRPTCFVVMPITTPEHLVSRYGNDPDHFAHLLDFLIRPALVAAGFEVVEPSMRQGEFIHAEVIKNLRHCDLVLCDVSTPNANVFMELGIRTVLDRPVALIRDEFAEKVPFDIGVISHHVYRSDLVQPVVRDEIPKLSQFVKSVFEKADNKNALWQSLGATAGPFGTIIHEVVRQYEETQDPIARVMQRIVKLCTKHRVELQGVKWELGGRDGVNGEYVVQVTSIALEAEAAFERDLNKIGEQFDTAVVFATS